MSSEWYQIRSTDIDSNTLRYTQLLNKINIGQFSSTQKEDIKKPKIISETTESKVVYQDPFYLNRRHGLYTQHEMPTEPNATDLLVHLRFAYIDAKIEDLSYMENHGNLNGLPLLCPGHNDGVIGLFMASKFNYDIARHRDYARIALAPSINLSNLSAGFSISFLFRPLSFEEDEGFKHRLFDFMPEADGSEYASLRYTVDGKVEFFVNDEGTTYDLITSSNALLSRSLYKLTATYDPFDTPRLHVYKNLVELSDETSGSAETPIGSTNDAFIAVRSTKNQGACHSIIHEFKMHKRPITFDEHLNNWYNMRSIDSIKYGGFAVPGYWFIRDDVVPTPDFDIGDFDSNDFS